MGHDPGVSVCLVHVHTVFKSFKFLRSFQSKQCYQEMNGKEIKSSCLITYISNLIHFLYFQLHAPSISLQGPFLSCVVIRQRSKIVKTTQVKDHFIRSHL